VQEEIPEVFMVVCSNTIANPWAVMVHSHDTLVTNRTVVGARRPEYIALEAVTPVYQTRVIRVEFVMHIAFD
jgi:hypothetical protein